MRTCRSPVFEADLKLHLYSVNDACVLTSSAVVENRKNSLEPRQVPSSVKNTSQYSHQLTHSSDDDEFNWKWLRDEPDCKCKMRLFVLFFTD